METINTYLNDKEVEIAYKNPDSFEYKQFLKSKYGINDPTLSSIGIKTLTRHDLNKEANLFGLSRMI